ncbi:bifunctional DNA primase/polymerase [Mesorhizobium sp. M0036]
MAGAFSSDSNIGIALGDRSGNLVDIDFDWPEAAILAQHLLPEFPGFGRKGAPGSHRLAICAMSIGRFVFQLPPPLPTGLGRERTMVLELRGTGHQTMFPPSVHPSREVVQWTKELTLVPAIESRELERRCGLVAGLAVILKAYPRERGDRDNICLALTGSLIRAGLADEEVDRLVQLVASEAGDEEANKRGGKAAATRRRIEAGETAWGIPELCNRLGIGSVEGSLRKWWTDGSAVPITIRTSREIVVRPGELPSVVDQAEQALLESGAENYRRGEALVRVMRLDAVETSKGIQRYGGSVRLKEVNATLLTEQLARSATWWRPSTEDKLKRIDPPPRIAAHYLARGGEWRVPPLVGITEAPTIRADGTLLQERGYDAVSQLFFEPGGVIFPAVSTSPKKADAEAALERLQRPLRQFPFADAPAKAAAVAAVLTAIARPGLRTAPLFAIDAPTAGTGKSLLAETIGVIATGHLPAMMSQGRNPEEDEKRLSSVLMAGDPVLVIDNCEMPITGDFLASMITQEIVQTRVLGRSEMIRLPQRTMVMATGNNLVVGGDMPRRVVLCRLDAGVERPDRLQYDFNPREQALAGRPELVAAGLTILAAYIAAGRPMPLPRLGSFEEWNVIREAVVWLGMEDPAQTRERLLQQDARTTEYSELLRIWHAVLGQREHRLNEISAVDPFVAGEEQQRGALTDALIGLTSHPRFNAKSIGHALGRIEDRILGDLVLRTRTDSRGKIYRVEKIRQNERP